MHPIRSWLKAARLQLHILGLLPVLVGSLVAYHRTETFSAVYLIFAELITLCVLVATALANDYADSDTDRLNSSFGKFSGGSRVIPSGLISRRQVGRAVIFASVLGIALSVISVLLFDGHPAIPALTAFGLFVGLEYSLPPLRINHRGLGEVVVAVMYSFFAVFFGFAAQQGLSYNPQLLYASSPLAAGMFLMILITEVPDRTSDSVSGKKTIPAILGERASYTLMIPGMAALFSGVLVGYLQNAFSRFTFYGLFAALPLGLALALMSWRARRFPALDLVEKICGLTLLLNVWMGAVLSVRFGFGV